MLPGMLIGLAVGIFLSLLIAAVVLRAACHLLKVKEPGLGRAMLISFIVGLVGFIINFVIAIGFDSSDHNADNTSKVALKLISIAINMFVAGGVYQAMLPSVSFGKGLLIYWIQVLILIAIVAVLVIPFYLLGFFGR